HVLASARDCSLFDKALPCTRDTTRSLTQSNNHSHDGTLSRAREHNHVRAKMVVAMCSNC
ncbi:MAG TPA: hypothetical protein VHW01_01010, partial [Polyangiaceae bacterium]|nr:hypothetical protein [Polyangiaceae bacterium]